MCIPGWVMCSGTALCHVSVLPCLSTGSYVENGRGWQLVFDVRVKMFGCYNKACYSIELIHQTENLKRFHHSQPLLRS